MKKKRAIRISLRNICCEEKRAIRIYLQNICCEEKRAIRISIQNICCEDIKGPFYIILIFKEHEPTTYSVIG